MSSTVKSLQQYSGWSGAGLNVPFGRQQWPLTHCAEPLQSAPVEHVLHFAKLPAQWPPVTDDAHEKHVPT
jgi:hypothetical protein